MEIKTRDTAPIYPNYRPANSEARDSCLVCMCLCFCVCVHACMCARVESCMVHLFSVFPPCFTPGAKCAQSMLV